MCQSYPNPQKDSPTDPSNYRPISLLPIYSKILEKLMYERLHEFLDKMDAFYFLQFCFRKKHSTNRASIILYNVCSLHRGMFSTLWVFSTSGDTMSTLGGYHKYIEGVQYIRGYHEHIGGCHEYIRGISQCIWRDTMSTSGDLQYIRWIA